MEESGVLMDEPRRFPLNRSEIKRGNGLPFSIPPVQFAALAAGWQLLIDNLESDTCECPLGDMGIAGLKLGLK